MESLFSTQIYSARIELRDKLSLAPDYCWEREREEALLS